MGISPLVLKWPITNWLGKWGVIEIKSLTTPIGRGYMGIFLLTRCFSIYFDITYMKNTIICNISYI